MDKTSRPQHLLPAAGSLAECIVALAETHPDRVALKLLSSSARPVELTYATLTCEAARVAHSLAAAGVQPGDVVVVVLPHGPELVHSFVGALLYGAVPSIFAPPSVKMAAESWRSTLEKLLGVCDTRFLITTGALAEGLSRDELTVLTPEDAQQRPGEFPFAPQPADAVALLQHSSGTTGLKKGVALSHRSVLNQVRVLGEAIALGADDRIVSWLPLYHDMGFIACFVTPLVTGVPVVMMSAFDWVARPAMLLEAIHQERGTLCWQPNFAYSLLATRVRPQDTRGLDLGSMRAFINCAEPVSAKSHRQFLERFAENGVTAAMLHTSYAMAENTFAVTQSALEAGPLVEEVDAEALARDGLAVPGAPGLRPTRTMVSSGTLVRDTEVRIVDARGVEVGERRLGEIAIRSTCMLTEYFHRPDVTAEAVRDGWYFTGDLGYRVGEHLVVTGRKKDMLIVAGKNIYPQDVEELVSEVSGVHPGRVVAFAVPNEALGTEDLVVLAETKETDRALQQAIRLAIAKAVRAELECTAKDVVLLPHLWLAKSSSGKISRQLNRDRYLREAAPAAPSLPAVQEVVS